MAHFSTILILVYGDILRTLACHQLVDIFTQSARGSSSRVPGEGREGSFTGIYSTTHSESGWKLNYHSGLMVQTCHCKTKACKTVREDQ